MTHSGCGCATLCILFVQPAAYSMIAAAGRYDAGEVLHLVDHAALPTITKVALRVLERSVAAERRSKRKPARCGEVEARTSSL